MSTIIDLYGVGMYLNKINHSTYTLDTKKIAEAGDQTQYLSIFIFKKFTAEPQQFVAKFIQINFQFWNWKIYIWK